MQKEKLSMIEMFSGIGCQLKGFKNSDLFDIDVVATSDIEPDAIYMYAIIHCGLTQEMLDTYDYPEPKEMAKLLTDRNIGLDVKKGVCKDWMKYTKGKKLKDLQKYYLATILSNNLGDISKIDKLPYADFWFYSFPCTDISVAGRQEGLSKGSGTRSGLLWEVERLLENAVNNNNSPQYLCLENVKNLVSKKFKPDFDLWIKRLEELGYNTYWSVINAKECGIPQNRERVYGLSIRKDIDKGQFEFPKPFDNGLRLKDVLDDEVDEKYYLSEKMVEKMTLNLEAEGKKFIDIVGHSGSGGQKGFIHATGGGIGALTATEYKQPRQILERKSE